MAASVQTDVAPNAGRSSRANGQSVDAVRVVDFTFSTSYPTGGEPLTLPSGISSVDFITVTPKNIIAAGSIFAVDLSTPTAPKLLAYVASTGAQVANTTDLSTCSVRLKIEGS